MKFYNRKHFPGYLLPVRPSWAAVVKGLFAINERVALSGNSGLNFLDLQGDGVMEK
jgi:phosphatidylserine decarboxylase